MLTILPILAFGISASIGQTSYGLNNDFQYWGCAEVNPSGFSPPIQFIDGVSPEACQAACAGQLLAAIAPDGCRCGNDVDAIMALDENACDHPCSQDPNSPMCGGSCKETTPPISNIFIIYPIDDGQDDVPEPADPPAISNEVSSLVPIPLQTEASADPVETTREGVDSSLILNEVTQVPSVSGDDGPSLTANSIPEVTDVSITHPDLSATEPISSAPSPTGPSLGPSVDSPSEPAVPVVPDTSIVLSEIPSTSQEPLPTPTTLVLDDGPTPSLVLVSGSAFSQLPNLMGLAQFVFMIAVIA